MSTEKTKEKEGAWAWMFPGQGSQHLGMGKELADNFAIVRHTLEEASDVLKISLPQLFWEDPHQQLSQTEWTQPSLLALSTACARILVQEGAPAPNVLLGHSLGEYSALVAARAMDFEKALLVVRERGRAMQEAVPSGGGMLAVIGLSHTEVEKLCSLAQKHLSVEPIEGSQAGGSQASSKAGSQTDHQAAGAREEKPVVEVANYNAPEQVVLSGHKAALQALSQQLQEKGPLFQEMALKRPPRCVLLKVSAPFHCSLMQGAAEALRAALNDTAFRAPQPPVIANIDAQAHSDDLWKERLLRQLLSPVRWVQSLETASTMGVEHFVELGPGKVLSGLLGRWKGSSKKVAYPTGTLDTVRTLLS